MEAETLAETVTEVAVEVIDDIESISETSSSAASSEMVTVVITVFLVMTVAFMLFSIIEKIVVYFTHVNHYVERQEFHKEDRTAVALVHAVNELEPFFEKNTYGYIIKGHGAKFDNGMWEDEIPLTVILPHGVVRVHFVDGCGHLENRPATPLYPYREAPRPLRNKNGFVLVCNDKYKGNEFPDPSLENFWNVYNSYEPYLKDTFGLYAEHHVCHILFIINKDIEYDKFKKQLSELDDMDEKRAGTKILFASNAKELADAIVKAEDMMSMGPKKMFTKQQAAEFMNNISKPNLNYESDEISSYRRTNNELSQQEELKDLIQNSNEMAKQFLAGEKKHKFF